MARNERSAGFVVYRRTPAGGIEFLVLDYGRHWDFAKGHVEQGEDDLAAALRELREETGIVDAAPDAEFRHAITYFFRDRRKGLIRKTVVFFLGETKARDDQVVLSDEHQAFEFLPFEAGIARITFPNARQILRLANQGLVKRKAGASETTPMRANG